MTCNIGRLLLLYLRDFVRKFGDNFEATFYNKLQQSSIKKKFSNFHVGVIQLNQLFSKFQGNDMAAFVAMCSEISLLIKQELNYNPNTNSDNVYCLSKALYLWSKIVPFLLVTNVEDKEDGHSFIKTKFLLTLVQTSNCRNKNLSTTAMVSISAATASIEIPFAAIHLNYNNGI